MFNDSSDATKQKAERDLERWEAAKRRRLSKELWAISAEEQMDCSDDDDEDSDRAIDTVIVTDTHRSLSIQTELTMQDLSNMELDNQKRIEEVKTLQGCNTGYPSEVQLQDNSKLLVFYTGLQSFTIFMAIFEFVKKGIKHSGYHKLSEYECFLLTLMKLRLNLSNYDLAFRFGISLSTAGRIFKKWIFVMNSRLGTTLVKWPNRDAIQRTMPFCFRVHYGLKVTAIIDCFELFIEKPSGLLAKACTWSQYKHYNTAKYLISITPQGVISFISRGWGGRASDQYITENSGFLRHVLSGDVILADRGFLVEESLGACGASLHIPAFTKGKDQLSALEIEKTRNIANVRIHVERVIGCVRQHFTILSATGVLPKEYYQYKQDDVVLLDAIVKVCCALTNMCEGVVPFD